MGIREMSLKRFFLIVVLVMITFLLVETFFWILFLHDQKAPIISATPSIALAQVNISEIRLNSVVDPKLENASVPIRLKIPKIKVDAVIESVSLTPNGAMDVPKGFGNVAWYNLGVLPGEIGSAVITGHFGPVNGKASIFDNLYKLSAGDKLNIEDNKGAIISFVVRESRSFKSDGDTSSVFDSNDGVSHLNLITCDGIWNKFSKSYSRRLVVFADKE